jgi:hypothetical protein
MTFSAPSVTQSILGPLDSTPTRQTSSSTIRELPTGEIDNPRELRETTALLGSGTSWGWFTLRSSSC